MLKRIIITTTIIIIIIIIIIITIIIIILLNKGNTLNKVEIQKPVTLSKDSTNR